MSNRNKIKQYCITFPQWEGERKDFIDSLPPVEVCKCVREEHEDGGHHLHAYVKFKNGITKVKLKSWLEIKYPDDWKRIHFDPVRNLDGLLDYCSKEDPDAYEVFGKKAKTKLQRDCDKINEDLKNCNNDDIKIIGRWELDYEDDLKSRCDEALLKRMNEKFTIEARTFHFEERWEELEELLKDWIAFLEKALNAQKLLYIINGA